MIFFNSSWRCLAILNVRSLLLAKGSSRLDGLSIGGNRKVPLAPLVLPPDMVALLGAAI